jgi:hypothetical protein
MLPTQMKDFQTNGGEGITACFEMKEPTTASIPLMAQRRLKHKSSCQAVPAVKAKNGT